MTRLFRTATVLLGLLVFAFLFLTACPRVTAVEVVGPASAETRIAELEAELAELKAKVRKLEQFVAGQTQVAAPAKVAPVTQQICTPQGCSQVASEGAPSFPQQQYAGPSESACLGGSCGTSGRFLRGGGRFIRR